MVVAISYLVEPETVLQYIGRIDTEGKKIFENDMVQYKIMISDGHGKSELKKMRKVNGWRKTYQVWSFRL